MEDCGEGSLKFEVITDLSCLYRLKPEWDELWNRTEGPANLSPAYAILGFETINRFPGQVPHCLAGRVSGRLVLLWPLMRYRTALWKTLRMLGDDAGEEADMLAEPGPRAQAHADAAWTLLLATARADRLALTHVRAGSLLDATVRRHGGARILDALPNQSWGLTWTPGQSWGNWYAGLSIGYRRPRRRRRTILSDLGELSFEVLEDQQECSGAVDLLMEWKRQWAQRTKPDGGEYWVHHQCYPMFLKRLLADRGGPARACVCALKVDGRIAAALVMVVGSARVDWIIAGFDAALARASPGLEMYEHALRWAHAHGLRVHMGVGDEVNKRHWCHDMSHPVTSYVVGLSIWGSVGQAISRLAHVIRKHSQHGNAAAARAE